MFPVFDHAVPVPEFEPVPGNLFTEIGAVEVQTVEDVNEPLWPAQITTPVVIGTGNIVITFVDTALLQDPFPDAVNVSVTIPAAISAAPGVYSAKVRESGLFKVPSPLVVQAIPSVFVAVEPEVMLIVPVFEQVDIAEPALAVGRASTFTIYVAVASVHGAFETVIVNVTVFPASPAAAV